MSDEVRRPRRRRERFRPNQPPPRPARRSEKDASRTRDQPDSGAEEALREAEQRFRTIFDTTSDGIFLHDLETRKLTMCNKSLLQMLGYTEEEFTKLTVADLHPEADLPFIYAQIEEFLRGGKPIRHDIRFKRKDGSILFADVSPDLVTLDGKRYVVAALKDITERKRAEETLAASERKYRSLVQNIPDVTWTSDREGRTLFISSNVLQVYGYSAEEICAGGNAWLDDVHPDDRPRIEKAFGEMLTRKTPFDVEYRIRRKDGNWIWLHDRSVSTYEEDGQWYADGVFSDVTQRKRMEEELRQHTEHLEELVAARTGELQESEARYRSLYHTIADGIFVVGVEGQVQDVNDSACAQLGYSRAELIGMPLAAISARPGFHLGEIFDRLRTAGSLSYETTHRRKDGAVIPVELSVTSIEYRGQLAVLGVARDITERKRAEEALRESEERFRTAFEEGAVPMALTALDTTLLKVNSAFCRMLGYHESELVGRSYAEITHPDDRATNLAGSRRMACGAIASFRMEKRYLRKDGTVVWGDMHTASVRDDRGRPLYCVTHIQDVTERRQAEETLRGLNERLELQVAQRTEELRRTVGRLQQLTLELSQAEDRERKRIADILHDDVQQTLAAARFHLNLLSSGPRSAEESGEIVEQVKHMLKDAIEKSRHLSHELSPALYQVDLTAILEWLARHMEQKHGLTVRVEARDLVDSPSEPLKAFLYKVAQELLFNVVKHAGVSEARIRVRRLGSCLYLSVADQGRGFDPQRLEGAAGFGLLSIRERVQLLGGRMKIRSVPGRGSRILIAVPDQETSGAPLP